MGPTSKRIMIEYIRGGIAELSPATAIIDCNGLGYGVNISLNTYAAIQGKKECKLYIYEYYILCAKILFQKLNAKGNIVSAIKHSSRVACDVWLALSAVDNYLFYS